MAGLMNYRVLKFLVCGLWLFLCVCVLFCVKSWRAARNSQTLSFSSSQYFAESLVWLVSNLEIQYRSFLGAKMQLLLGLALLATASAYTSEAEADKVTNLPGLVDAINFNQFSGYLSIPGANGNSKHMHYWLVESMNSPSSDPLTFWTNGGPGCSGLLGFLEEQGPFRPNADGTLSLNNYAWNKVSNMVFIESPAGVGFSYSDESADQNNGDAGTALDNYNLIQAFLARFPEFASSDLYISSESYGGHYMPTLAKQIVDSNAAGVTPKLNFKGFAVGNPYTDVYSGTPAMIDTYWGHQLVPKPLYDQYTEACYGKVAKKAKCNKLTAQLANSVGNLNPYALDYPVCTDDSSTSRKMARRGRAQRVWFFNNLLKSQGVTDEEMKALGLPVSDEYEPCEDDYTSAYLNTAAVKDALHVKRGIKWNSCSYKLKYNYSDSDVSTAPIYNYLIDGGFGLNILVYSGDDDSVCGTVGTQEWIWGLGYTVTTDWEVYTVNKQTAGYLTKWGNNKFAFLTVHNAGHEVPTYVPEIALDLFTKYLHGEFTA
jgi:carboxypeptidase C (cathepsin A)